MNIDLSKVATSLITKLLESTLKGVYSWIGNEAKKRDLLGEIAKKYSSKLIGQYNYVRIPLPAMNNARSLSNLFIALNLKPEPDSSLPLSQKKLNQKYNWGTFSDERNQPTITGIEAIDQNRKLLVLGKAGSGKSTYLRYLALYHRG